MNYKCILTQCVLYNVSLISDRVSNINISFLLALFELVLMMLKIQLGLYVYF